MARWQAEVQIAKVDVDARLVTGWLSIAVGTDGNIVTDEQGDQIDILELEKAASAWMLNSRDVGQMHVLKSGVGRPTESVVFTPDKIRALGLAPNALPLGWLVTIHVDDDETWRGVKSGAFTGFSIGGSGIRQKVG